MNDAVTFEIDPHAVAAIFKQIERGMNDLNMSMGRAVGGAVSSILSQLARSTRVSPKQRQVEELPSRFAKAGKRDYAITGWFGHPRTLKTRVITNTDLDTVTRHQAIIRYRGFARKVWSSKYAFKPIMTSMLAAVQDLAGNSELDNKTSRYISAESSLDGGGCWVKITNRLDYAADALEGGESTINSAMETASRSLEHSLDKQLVRSMGLGELTR